MRSASGCLEVSARAVRAGPPCRRPARRVTAPCGLLPRGAFGCGRPPPTAAAVVYRPARPVEVTACVRRRAPHAAVLFRRLPPPTTPAHRRRLRGARRVTELRSVADLMPCRGAPWRRSRGSRVHAERGHPRPHQRELLAVRYRRQACQNPCRKPLTRSGQRGDLDPPRREPQDARGGILLAVGPERVGS